MTVEYITLLEFCMKTTYFLFQGTFWIDRRGSNGFTNKPSVANLYVKDFEIRPIWTTGKAKTVEKVCGYHICDTENCRQEVPGAHQFHKLMHTVYSGRNKTTWFYIFPRHLCYVRTRQNPCHYSCQKAHSQRSIYTVVRPTHHCCETYYNEHPYTQSKDHLF